MIVDQAVGDADIEQAALEVVLEYQGFGSSCCMFLVVNVVSKKLFGERLPLSDWSDAKTWLRIEPVVRRMISRGDLVWRAALSLPVSARLAVVAASLNNEERNAKQWEQRR